MGVSEPLAVRTPLEQALSASGSLSDDPVHDQVHHPMAVRNHAANESLACDPSASLLVKAVSLSSAGLRRCRLTITSRHPIMPQSIAHSS
jgi:hypothetical protein